ncbi:hypothetical protein FVE85_0325 [Porphyridium purpureum]|uniref:EamA domain-containing protein n=1 Tax=Porphyridium purpureum TaxID=35688 RepID=A0A5J4YZ51_PORPP|nr:hypothetical protein FVE85_0325 [Porphyridium purpureum]|eukprot:POR5018..scf208_2
MESNVSLKKHERCWRWQHSARMRSADSRRLVRAAFGVGHGHCEKAGDKTRPVARSVLHVCGKAPRWTMGLKDQRRAPRVQSLAVLALVPLCWGTYNVAVRTVYDALPLAPLQLNALCYIVSSASLLAVSRLEERFRPSLEPNDVLVPSEPQSPWSLQRISKNPSIVLVAFELAMYLFAGSTLQLFALRTANPSKAAFLIQTTSAMVPAAESVLRIASGQRRWNSMPNVRVFAAVLLAASGVALVSLDEAASAIHLEQVDALILLAAACYSMHVLRLSHLSQRLAATLPEFSSVMLARLKAQWQLLFALLGVMVSAELNHDIPLQSMSEMGQQTWASFGLAVLWIGGICSALPTWAQTQGQRDVDASSAALMYASQPIWSSVFAYLCLDEPVPTEVGPAAAAFLLSALVVARGEEEQNGD